MAPYVFFFPWTSEAGEEEDFSFSVTTISLFKKTPTPLARSFPRVGEEGGDVFLGQFLGRQHSGRPSHVPPLFLPIKTGKEKEKRAQESREAQEIEKKRAEDQKKTRKGKKAVKKEKQRRREGRQRRRRERREYKERVNRPKERKKKI